MGVRELFQGQLEARLAQYGKKGDESVQSSSVRPPAARNAIR